MINRYRVMLNVPEHRWPFSYRCIDVGSRKTRERALRLAERILKKYTEYCARYREPRWPFSCSVYDEKRTPVYSRGRGVLARLNEEDVRRLEAPIESVGERGVW